MPAPLSSEMRLLGPQIRQEVQPELLTRARDTIRLGTPDTMTDIMSRSTIRRCIRAVNDIVTEDLADELWAKCQEPIYAICDDYMETKDREDIRIAIAQEVRETHYDDRNLRKEVWDQLHDQFQKDFKSMVVNHYYEWNAEHVRRDLYKADSAKEFIERTLPQLVRRRRVSEKYVRENMSEAWCRRYISTPELEEHTAPPGAPPRPLPSSPIFVRPSERRTIRFGTRRSPMQTESSPTVVRSDELTAQQQIGSTQVVARSDERTAEQSNTNDIGPDSHQVAPPTALPASADKTEEPTLRRSSRKRKAPADHDESHITQAKAPRVTTAGRSRRSAAAALELDENLNDTIPTAQQPNAPTLTFPPPTTHPTPPRPTPGPSTRPYAPYQLPLDDDNNNVTSGTPMPEMHPLANSAHHPEYLQGLEQPEMLDMPPRKPRMRDSMRGADAGDDLAGGNGSRATSAGTRRLGKGKGKRAKVGRVSKK